MDKKSAEYLAKAIALACVRNGYIEDLHSGTTPGSKTGDYSDVKVVSPYGEIPWEKLSRISDDEMKVLMKEIVNKLYTVLLHFEDKAFLTALLKMGDMYTQKWDKPEELSDFVLRNRDAAES